MASRQVSVAKKESDISLCRSKLAATALVPDFAPAQGVEVAYDASACTLRKLP